MPIPIGGAHDAAPTPQPECPQLVDGCARCLNNDPMMACDPSVKGQICYTGGIECPAGCFCDPVSILSWGLVWKISICETGEDK